MRDPNNISGYHRSTTAQISALKAKILSAINQTTKEYQKQHVFTTGFTMDTQETIQQLYKRINQLSQEVQAIKRKPRRKQNRKQKKEAATSPVKDTQPKEPTRSIPDPRKPNVPSRKKRIEAPRGLLSKCEGMWRTATPESSEKYTVFPCRNNQTKDEQQNQRTRQVQEQYESALQHISGRVSQQNSQIEEARKQRFKEIKQPNLEQRKENLEKLTYNLAEFECTIKLEKEMEEAIKRYPGTLQEEIKLIENWRRAECSGLLNDFMDSRRSDTTSGSKGEIKHVYWGDEG